MPRERGTLPSGSIGNVYGHFNLFYFGFSLRIHRYIHRVASVPAYVTRALQPSLWPIYEPIRCCISIRETALLPLLFLYYFLERSLSTLKISLNHAFCFRTRKPISCRNFSHLYLEIFIWDKIFLIRRKEQFQWSYASASRLVRTALNYFHTIIFFLFIRTFHRLILQNSTIPEMRRSRFSYK